MAGLLLLLAAGRLRPGDIAGFCIALSNAYGLIAGALRLAAVLSCRGLVLAGGQAPEPAGMQRVCGSPLAQPRTCCCSNTPAFAAIFLLGFGLVAVPRQLWCSADPHGEQRRLCHAAGAQAQRAAAARRRLSAAVLMVRRASVLFPQHDPLRPLMDVVVAQASSVGEPRPACCFNWAQSRGAALWACLPASLTSSKPAYVTRPLLRRPRVQPRPGGAHSRGC